MMSANDRDEAELHLSEDEAIVLFDLLSRWSEAGHKLLPDAFESPAERAVLDQLLAHLEKQLVVPFKPEYREIVEGARRRLVERWAVPIDRT